MTLATFDVDVNALNAFHSATSKVTPDTAEKPRTIPFKDITTNKINILHVDGQHTSASAADLPAKYTYKGSKSHHPATCTTHHSIDPTDDIHHLISHMTSTTTSEMMQDSKVSLGPHASIVMRERKLLWNTAATVTPMYLDTDYIGTATITAVSK